MTAPSPLPAFLARCRAVLAQATPGALTTERRSVHGADGSFVANHSNPRDPALHVLAVNSLPALLDVAEAAAAYRRASDTAWTELLTGPGGTMPELMAADTLNKAEIALDLALSRLAEVPHV